MGKWMRGRIGRTRTKRALCAYLALVLAAAVGAPALVFAAEGEAELPPLAGEPPETGDLVIRTFEDCDGNGVWDDGESASAGWRLRVSDESGCEIGSGTTDANGWLSIQGLAPGTLQVALTLQAGWNNTTPLSQTLVLEAGTTARVCFGITRCLEPLQPGQVIVRAFEDLNEDGTWGAGEPALEGWYFTLHDESHAVIGSGTTDSNGWLLFEGLPEGEVLAVETLQAGWNNTTPLSQSASVVAGTAARLCFGNVRCVEAPETGSIVVRKFEDLDEDGVWDEGEHVLAGFEFTLHDCAHGVVGSGTTDTNGWLMFDGLPAGAYTVAETLRSGWTNTTPLSQSASVSAGTSTRVYFGNIRQAEAPENGSVRVHKFADDNENGVMDAGELLLSGWSFLVRDAEGATVVSGVTDATGMLDFELPPGTYTVTETLIPGWTNTTAVAQGVTIVAGQMAHLYFGNAESFLPFTPQPAPTVVPSANSGADDPFLPFTGGEYLALLATALASGIAGIVLRRRPRETA